MNVFVPNYYRNFKCIADKCRHSCCIGWEIDIDDDTLQYYGSLKGEFAGRLSRNISKDEPHFILDENERCPFLNGRGLCDIICTLGEEALCNICTDHPRFRNFYSDLTEMGLGLCCEEAANVVLSFEGKFDLVPFETDGEVFVTEEEQIFFEERAGIFARLQDRETDMAERIGRLAGDYDFGFSLKELCEIYLSLERLDEKWTELIQGLGNFSFNIKIFSDFQIQFEQLACYFLFRHLSAEEDFSQAIRFALAGCVIIGALCDRYKSENGYVSAEQMKEFARMYSAEVEYSEENMDEIYVALCR